jgi:sugar fermentation stimulation protein A
MSTEEAIYKVDGGLLEARVIARPSKICKSPYLADIEIVETGEKAIAHTPALGCAGLIATDCTVFVGLRSGAPGVSKYIVYCALDGDNLVGVHPTLANQLVRSLIERGLICPGLGPLQSEAIEGDCRFDFCAEDEGRKTFIEVKSAIIGDYVDCLNRWRTIQLLAAKAAGAPKMAIFPYGTERKEGLVSERALKHVVGLTRLATEGHRSILIYVTQRTDCDYIRISTLDAVYRKAVMEDAKAAGVEIIGVALHWGTDGSVYFHEELEII